MDCNCSDDKQQLSIMSLGDRLREARESVGLSQDDVARCLHLKLSIIKSIEDGYCMHALKISSIFFRGYIRAYARLVHIDNVEEEIKFMSSSQLAIKSSVINDGKNRYNFINVYRQYTMRVNFWILCGVVVFFVFVICILIMWYAKYLFLKNEYLGVVNLKSVRFIAYNECEKNTRIFSGWFKEDLLNRSYYVYFKKKINFFNNYVQRSVLYSFFGDSEDVEILSCTIKIDDPIDNIVNYINDISHGIICGMNNRILSLSFTSDCWVKVMDSSENILYVGTKYSGDILNLKGNISYRLVIGAPK